MALQNTVAILALAFVLAIATLGQPILAAKFVLTPQQRRQLLELRSIVENALKAVNSKPVQLAAKSTLTPQERQQVLELRSIVDNALKAVNGSDTGTVSDTEVPEVKRGWNSTEVILVHWWQSRPFMLSGIFVGFLVVTLIVIVVFYFTPLYVVKSSERQGSSSKPSFSSDLTFGELPLQCAEPFGTIRYLMKYQPRDEQLMVTVRNCSSLPINNKTHLLDPYVQVRVAFEKAGSNRLEPTDDTLKCSSEHVTNSVNPVFNFSKTFQVAREKLPKAIVFFEIYDWNSGIKHTMVARHKHAIQDATEGHQIDDILSTDFADFEGKLKRGHRIPNTGPGDICVQLERGLQKEPLRVTVIECKGVYLRDPEGKLDEQTIPNVYVSVKLIEPGGRVHARRTRTVRRSRNPYFNEGFHFDVALEKLSSCTLRLSLIHISDILRIRQTIGTVELSAEEEDNRLAWEHWEAIAPTPSIRAKKKAISSCMPQQSRASRCSWHYLVTPEELAKLRAAREAKKQRKQQRSLAEKSLEGEPDVTGLGFDGSETASNK